MQIRHRLPPMLLDALRLQTWRSVRLFSPLKSEITTISSQPEKIRQLLDFPYGVRKQVREGRKLRRDH